MPGWLEEEKVCWTAAMERIDYIHRTSDGLTVVRLDWVSDGEQEESESIFK